MVTLGAVVADAPSASKLTHAVVDDLCGRAVNYGAVCTAGASGVLDAVARMKEVAISCVATVQTPAAIAERVAAAAPPAPLAAAVAEAIAVRAVELRRALANKATEISAGHLSDFDWSLRLVLSTDKLSDARHPVLLLTLSITQADGTRRDEVVELGADSLDSLLSDFSNVAATMRRVR